MSRHVRLHDTLRCILSLSPGGQAGLYSTLTEMFPYKLQQKETLVTYVKETLLMCEYLPHFQQRILDLVVARCIEIDVDIEIDADTETARSPLPSDQREAHDEDMFAFEDDVSSRGVAPQSSGGRRVRISSEGLADSLDGMLCVVLRFVEAQFNHKDTAARERVFLQLIGIFERRLLTTHRSKFVQFIIFYMCAKHNDYGEIFCRRLLDVFFQTKNVTDQRHGAVMYLASFFCRSLSCSAQVIRYDLP